MVHDPKGKGKGNMCVAMRHGTLLAISHQYVNIRLLRN